MTEFNLSLPIDIPWKLIAASQDMMDVRFCDKAFPPSWRSSAALFAFEPNLEDMQEGPCKERITFLKVTVSITGYQPNSEGKAKYIREFPDFPIAILDPIIDEYWACYGALLNVAVHPLAAARQEADRPDQARVTDLTTMGLGEYPDPLYQEGFRFDVIDGRAAERGTTSIISKGNTRGLDIGSDIGSASTISITLPFSSHYVGLVLSNDQSFSATGYLAGRQVAVGSTSANGDATIIVLQAESMDEVVLRQGVRVEDPPSPVLLRVEAIGPAFVRTDNYPHIVNFEPKMRDLYQAATEMGEILSASKSEATTGKSLTRTNSQETGVKAGAEVNAGPAKITSEVSHKWGSTDTEERTLNSDASRELRDTQGATTSISQMYNLLCGYHLGTNRATFLILPRPHTIQPTEYRTFVKGLRMIEGVQEFFLVVTRPLDQDGLCVELRLDTGHFPEKVDKEQSIAKYSEMEMSFVVTAYAHPGKTAPIEGDTSSTFTAPAGWVIDITKGNAGVTEGLDSSTQQALRTLNRYNYRRVDDSTISVTGEITGAGVGATFRRAYTAHLRSQTPSVETSSVVTSPFITARRSLCACFKLDDGCPFSVEPSKLSGLSSADYPQLVLEKALPIPDEVLRDGLREEREAEDYFRNTAVASRQLLSDIRSTLVKSGSTSTLSGDSPGSFSRTEVFRDRVVREIVASRPDALEQMGAPLRNFLPSEASDLPDMLTYLPVSEVLRMPLGGLGEAVGGQPERAAALRAYFLRRLSTVVLGSRDRALAPMLNDSGKSSGASQTAMPDDDQHAS